MRSKTLHAIAACFPLLINLPANAEGTDHEPLLRLVMEGLVSLECPRLDREVATWVSTASNRSSLTATLHLRAGQPFRISFSADPDGAGNREIIGGGTFGPDGESKPLPGEEDLLPAQRNVTKVTLVVMEKFCKQGSPTSEAQKLMTNNRNKFGWAPKKDSSVAARTILSRHGLAEPPPLHVNDLLIQHALDLIILDEAEKHLFGAHERSRGHAAARRAGTVESIRRLLSVAVQLGVVIRTSGMARAGAEEANQH